MTQQAEPDAMPADDKHDAAPGETPRAPKRVTHADGFGAAFCASMAALCAEAAIGGTAALLVMLSRDHDSLPSGIVVVAGLVVAVALLAVLVSGFVTAVTVMPVLALARRVARRAGRAERWWWTLAAVPLVAAAAVVVFGGVAALGSLSLAPPPAYLLWWGALTVGLSPASLVAGAASRRVRDGRPVRMARRVVRDGLLAWLAVGALGAGAYGTGLVKVYEPPRLEKADLVGVWSDGHGGEVELTSTGTAVAKGLDNYVWDGMGHAQPKDCDGSGKWVPVKREGSVEGVSLTIGSCELARTWSVGGTGKEPRISHEVGKPGSGKHYTLAKVVAHKK
ncbi:hypothetical protein AF335_22865 [Streptomyces eurocidicus]|uniref:Uncharacterized membrane protein YhaH (DUF805 family) n=1 Tax=Streptomyces eurocidicus TaxID=66423 RepID=A0A2N8NSG6_STREU|nr:hypothetical protein [Streptomyces eurocidicus]MBB5121617.1 uncharacterized membrane protein YhaH (DUF805 family) [Streptomyces eurocidicus]MBF6054739.1 hypothetical protein [Streptomyces eurocidicus]PNE31701.1 hypothetical protein AF335_22865 [Streptomyces eurocidicus]